MSIRWVGQEDDLGCVAACLAMVTGRSYAEAKHVLANHCGNGPVRNWVIDMVLSEWSFAVCRLFAERQKQNGGIWPRWPISDVHLCTVTMPFPHPIAKTHMVVLLHDGTVLDPTTRKPQTLGVYPEIHTIAGIVPVEMHGR